MSTFYTRLNEYLKYVTQCQLLRARELAEGVVAIEDSWGEFDIYLDTELWEVVNPVMWAGIIRPPPEMIERSLNVIRGESVCFGGDFEAAFASAQRHLSPRYHTNWSPRDVVEMSDGALIEP